jgi:large subunit ribosomal protein L30
MATIRVTRIRSTIKSLPKQKLTMKALGLLKMNDSREFEATPAVLGSIDKVKHLVKIENI